MCCLWEGNGKTAYGSRVRQNLMGEGLKIGIDLYLQAFAGGSQTKHESCGREQENIHVSIPCRPLV